MSKSNEHESGDDRRERQCEEDLKAKIAALQEALHLAWGVIEWMSGADDFALGGKAHAGWIEAQYDISQIRSLIIGAALAPQGKEAKP
jgi:hypothetical protein